MTIRFIMVLLGFALGIVGALFGASLPAQHHVAWVPLTGAPWFSINMITDVAWLLVFVAGAAAVAAVLLVIEQLGELFSHRTRHVSRGRIAFLAFVMAGGCLLWGWLAQPYQWEPAWDKWFFRYPASIPLWVLFAPLGIVLLNFLREIGYAVREYEKQASGLGDLSFPMEKRLDIIQAQLHIMLTNLMEHSEKGSPLSHDMKSEMAYLRNEMNGLSKSIRGVVAEQRKQAETMSRQFGGFYARLRQISASRKEDHSLDPLRHDEGRPFISAVGGA